MKFILLSAILLFNISFAGCFDRQYHFYETSIGLNIIQTVICMIHAFSLCWFYNNWINKKKIVKKVFSTLLLILCSIIAYNSYIQVDSYIFNTMLIIIIGYVLNDIFRTYKYKSLNDIKKIRIRSLLIFLFLWFILTLRAINEMYPNSIVDDSFKDSVNAREFQYKYSYIID